MLCGPTDLGTGNQLTLDRSTGPGGGETGEHGRERQGTTRAAAFGTLVIGAWMRRPPAAWTTRVVAGNKRRRQTGDGRWAISTTSRF
jgi:hypothetical protein